MWENGIRATKRRKREAVNGSDGDVGMEVEGYLAPAEESISLVEKSMGIPETTSGGFAHQIAGVGQMKLETPP